MYTTPAKVIKAPEPLPLQRTNGVVWRSVFLAGSIEMGKAVDWQKKVTEEISPWTTYIFNPRRDDWDSSWTQRITNEQFSTQVSWEMTAMDISSYIFMYFAPDTKSPISLLELGLHAKDNKLIVCCPNEFWRKGNVEMVCDRFNIPLYLFLDDAIEELKFKVTGFR